MVDDDDDDDDNDDNGNDDDGDNNAPNLVLVPSDSSVLPLEFEIDVDNEEAASDDVSCDGVAVVASNRNMAVGVPALVSPVDVDVEVDVDEEEEGSDEAVWVS